jgi:hypothetical protein
MSEVQFFNMLLLLPSMAPAFEHGYKVGNNGRLLQGYTDRIR